jgi:hypothetical protein
MMFESRLSREFLEQKLSKLQKKTYNQFVWWRRYQQRQTLTDRRTLHDKILNGDYEPSDYYYQAEHENYLLEDVVKDMKTYEEKLDKISLFRARYKKLHEDFLKEEQEIMNNLRKDFWKEFRIDKEELDKMMEDFDGTVMDLYNHAVQLKNERVESRKPMPKVSVL